MSILNIDNIAFKFIFLILLAVGSAALTTDKCDKEIVTGVWLNDSKDAKIEIYESTENNYSAKIIWIKEPVNSKGEPRKDVNNENPKLSSREIVGLEIFSNLRCEGGNWSKVDVYSPKMGNSNTVEFSSDGKSVTISVSKYGRTFIKTWTKVN